MENLTIGAYSIAVERDKQIKKHGFTAEHHVNHPEWYSEGQLIYAANAISQGVNSESYPDTPENWDEKWFRNLCDRTHKERFIIAGALIAAEIDRITELEKQ